MSRHAFRAFLAVVTLPTALAFGGSAHADGLAVELRCSTGANGTDTLARLPITDVGQVNNCRVLISNNTGQALTNVDFHLGFGEAPVVDLIENPAIADYDPGAYYNCPSSPPPPGATYRPNMVLSVKTVFDGYSPGTSVSGSVGPYGDRCFDYNVTPSASWRVSIPAASTAALRVEFTSGFLVMGSDFTTALHLDVTNLPGGVTVAPIEVPVDVSIPVFPMEVRTIYEPIQSRSMSMAGTMFIGTDWSVRRGSQTGVSADFYLPYLHNVAGNYQLRLDGGYSAAAGDLLLYDPDDLELNTTYMELFDTHSSRFRDYATGEDTSSTTLKLPFEQVGEGAFHIDFGYLSGNHNDLGTRRIVVSWAARYSQDPTVQAFLAGVGHVATGRFCGSTDQTDEVCAQTNAPLYAEDVAIGHLYGQLEWTSFNLVANWENSATTAFADLIMNLSPPYLPWRGGSLTMVMQLPTNAQGHKGVAKNIYNLNQIYAPQPYVAYYSTAATDGGSEANLPARVVPSSGTGDWTGLGTVTFPTRTTVPGAATEIRVECQPSRYGVRNMGSRIECDPMMTWSVPRNARSSINGSSYDKNDMTRSSLGSTARVTMRDDTGTARRDARHAFNVEVEGGSRYSLNLVHDTSSQTIVPQFWPFQPPPDRTTNQYASAGCVFANVGLDNVYGPVTMVLDWPVGWEPTPGADPLTGVQVLWGPQTLAVQNANWNQTVIGTPVPGDAYAIEIDPDARQLMVVFDGPRLDSSFAAADQVSAPYAYEDARWVGFRMDGMPVPGVARRPEWSCSVMLDRSLAPDGTVLEDFVFEPPAGQLFRILGEPAPVLGGGPSPATVASHASWTTTVDLRNAAYGTDGVRLLDGAAVSARDSVVYFRVPRDDDFPAVEQGFVDVTFTNASAPDAHAVWVTTAESPDFPVDSELAAPWVKCADAGQTCDAIALALLGLTKEQIRWVAFALDEVLVTDAAPRGTAPGSGVARAENPYLCTITMTDQGSDNDVTVRPKAYFVSQDTLRLEPVPDIYDVTIVEGCAACDDSNVCTTDRCDSATQLCVYDPVPCGERGLFAPVKDRSGAVVGAIHCQQVDGGLDCDVGEDTDGDGRPNLIIYPAWATVCGGPSGGDSK